MEEMDDDFGDLYADVEAQVSSVISDIPGFTKLYTEEEDNTTQNLNPKEEFVSDSNKVESIVAELNKSVDDASTQKSSGSEAVAEEKDGMAVDNGSDSEDDFNIVLNDEDCPAFPTSARNGAIVGVGNGEDEGNDSITIPDGNGSGKFRSDGLEQSLAGNGADRGNGVKGGYNSQFSQFKYVRPHSTAFPSNGRGHGRGDWEENVWNQYRGSTTAIPGGCGFSLPRYRTILDVNIDAFEQKPWRRPGVDITDFFNFGFDEQSWKDYCNSVDQFRQQTLVRNRFPAYKSSKYNQAHEAGFEHEKVDQEAVAEETPQDGQPRGRAIEVEGSVGERQPSMDVRRPRNRDTDVVIQITTQDLTEGSSGVHKEDLGHIASTVKEGSENGGSDADDNRVIHCLVSTSGDELSGESQERGVRKLKRPSTLKRSSEPRTSSNSMCVDSDNHGSGKNNGQYHQKEDVHSSEGNVEAMETHINKEEQFHRNMCVADPCRMKSESPLGDQVQCCLSLSSLGSHSEASSDDVYPETIQKPLRHSLNIVTELRESHASDYHLFKDYKTNSTKVRSGNHRYRERNRSPIWEQQTRPSRRLHGVAQSKIGPYDNGGVSPMYHKKVFHDKIYSPGGHPRQKEWLHDYCSFDREDIPYFRETEACFSHWDKRFTDNHAQTAYFKNSRRRGPHSARDEADPYLTRKWDDREYYSERRITRMDDEILERDWYHRERELTFDDMDSPAYTESRRLVSKYSSYTDKEEDTRWRERRDEHYFRRKMENDDRLLDWEHADDFMREKYLSDHPSIEKRRIFLDEKYEQRLHFPGREVQYSGRRERYVESPTLDLEYSCSMEIDGDYHRHIDPQILSPRFCREPHSVDRGRLYDTISTRDDVHDLSLTERYGRHQEQMYSRRCRDRDWNNGYYDAHGTENDINYPNDQVHFRRRRYSWLSRELHRIDDELISRHRDDELYDEEASLFHERISKHEGIHAKDGPGHDMMLIDDEQLKQHRYRMIRKENSGNFVNSGCNVGHRGKHEQTTFRSRNSVDVVVGNGKSSGRVGTKPTSMACNGKSASFNPKTINKEQTTFKDFNQTVKDIQPDIPNNSSKQEKEKWFDKFPVAESKEALDIEEGQIVTDEPEKKTAPVQQKNHVSESAAAKKTMLNGNIANGKKVVEGFDKDKIAQTLAKMEKRRERFKEALSLKKEPDKAPPSQVEPVVETAEITQQRPIRKRRWVGS